MRLPSCFPLFSFFLVFFSYIKKCRKSIHPLSGHGIKKQREFGCAEERSENYEDST